MKRKLYQLGVVFLLIMISQLAIYSQTTGAIAGTVIDSNGAVVPNATVTVKGQGGQEFTSVTNDNGNYRIPAVAAGSYSVTVSASGFKKSVVSNVKVDVGFHPTPKKPIWEETDNINLVEHFIGNSNKKPTVCLPKTLGKFVRT